MKSIKSFLILVSVFFLRNLALFMSVWLAFAAGFSLHRDPQDLLFIIFLIPASLAFGYGYKIGAFDLTKND